MESENHNKIRTKRQAKILLAAILSSYDIIFKAKMIEVIIPKSPLLKKKIKKSSLNEKVTFNLKNIEPMALPKAT